MTIEEMRERKRELGYSYEMLSKISGVPLGTVQKVLGGVTKSPRYDTILALEQALTEPLCVRDSGNREEAAAVRSPMAAYRVDAPGAGAGKNPGAYTLEDYYALPEEKRVELIDGKFYDMAAPTAAHQLIGGEIFSVFRDHIRRSRGACIPLFAPVDVQLNRDEKTMLQPDVLILCDRGKLRRGVIYGAPDLVVEILSASTISRDMIVKMNQYYMAGVREYWIVDPKGRKIRVYQFGTGEEPSYQEYDGNEKVPVGIWDGACQVDFGEIFAYLDSLEGI